MPSQLSISLWGSVLLACSFLSPGGLAQTAQATPSDQKQGPVQDENGKPCVQPAPLFSPDDYKGPLSKVVAAFTRKLEIKTVHAPRRPKGPHLCALDASEKFRLFVANSAEPVTFVGAAYSAGIAQAENTDPTFGQGASGYGQRYGVALADTVSSDFFHTFLFPVVFRQDPRYYRLREGTTARRTAHALAHAFVARGDSGKDMFNFSEWLGTGCTAALSNTYHLGNRRGWGPGAQRVAINVGTDTGFDVLREFWPEIVRKMKLPFRDRDHDPSRASPSQPH